MNTKIAKKLAEIAIEDIRSDLKKYEQLMDMSDRDEKLVMVVKRPSIRAYEKMKDGVIMSREEFLEEVDEAISSFENTKSKVDEVFHHVKDATKRYQEAYNKGLEDGRNEVWELARKLEFDRSDGGLSIDEVKRVFGCSVYDVFKHYTPQEALAKLDAYEKELGQ